MLKEDFYIVLQYTFKSTTGSLWKNKENRKLPSYSFQEVTYILTNELTLYNYKWLLNNSLEHYGT